MADVEDSIKEAVKKDRIVIGTKSVIKGMKNGRLSMAIYASNTPKNSVRDLGHYSGISKAEVKEFKENSASLGGLCGKPFHILMVGIRK